MILREKPGKPIVHAVRRGGNWNNGANAGPLSVNLNNAPSNSNSNIGFRCTSRARSLTVMLLDLQGQGLWRQAQSFREAHRLTSYEVAGSAESVLPAQFSAAKISQLHRFVWCLQCRVTASTDDLINIFGGSAEAW